jgi:predicted TIM-barrel fold metal-dependent hydrolase
MQRCATLGLKSVMLSAFPSGKGHPTPDDDGFWAEALRIHMPLTIHVDMDRSGRRGGPLIVYSKREGLGDSEAARRASDFAGQLARFAFRGAVNAVQLMVAGVFDRFPDLRILMAENQIGWVPTFMTVADERYERHVDWAQQLLDIKPLANGQPSDYIRRHVLWGFQRDPAGVELRHWLGVENLIWGSDFPHQESEYPHSLRVIEENFRGVPDTERHAMVCGNIAAFLNLPVGGSGTAK